MILDEEQLFRDDLAERRRDREREPHRRNYGGRPKRDDPGRNATMVRVHTSITALRCPACSGPVYATADSTGEELDCFGCDARLVTRQALGGEVEVVERTGGAL